MLHVVATTFYLYWKKETLWPVYGAIIIFLIISGIFGYWVLAEKLPLNGLNVKVTVTHVWSGYANFYEDNITTIFFNLTFSNPTDRALSFQLESDAFYINDTKLTSFSYGRYWSYPHTIQAYQEISFDTELTIEQRFTRTENGKFENFWLSLMQQPFKFSMSGIISKRFYYGPADRSLVAFPTDYSFVVAAKTFVTSYIYLP